MSGDMTQNLKFTENHEWIDPVTGRCGITDYAQKMLKEIVFADLPEIGRLLTKGEPTAAVESVKAVTDVLAPVAGKVVDVNRALEDAPELINADPYGAGWIFALQASSQEEAASLMSADEYATSIS